MGTGEEVAAAHYRTRAESFLRALRHISDRGLFDDDEVDRMAYATALLAVHAAIALSDSILVLKTGSRSTAQDHREAATTLKKVCVESSASIHEASSPSPGWSDTKIISPTETRGLH